MKFLTLLVLSALTLGQTDPHGWGNAHWGMTKQQLVERVGAKDVPRRTIYGPERESRLGLDFALNTLKFRAYFFVDEVAGLDLVQLVCQSIDYLTLADFNRLEADLTAKYGPPRTRKVDTKHGIDAEAVWAVGSTAIDLVFINIEGRAGDKVIRSKGLDITYKRIGVDKL
jgi:hypothetical protein